MKLKALYITRIICLVLLIFLSDTILFSQGFNRTGTKQNRIFISISAGPSMNHIINEGILSIAGLNSKSSNSISGTFDLGYFFSKFVGVSTGIDYDSYSSDVSLNTYQNKFNTTDSENETYERRVSGSDIKEHQKISFLSVPLSLNFRLPLGERSGFYIQTGVDFSFPLSNEYNSSGTFTFTGFYPAYNVLLQNLPAYGFPSDAIISSNGKLLLKSASINGLASAGFQFLITKQIQLALGATYSRSLSTISGYTSPENFQLSSDINQINSMMGGSSKVIAQSVGLRLSLRYYIK